MNVVKKKSKEAEDQKNVMIIRFESTFGCLIKVIADGVSLVSSILTS